MFSIRAVKLMRQNTSFDVRRGLDIRFGIGRSNAVAGIRGLNLGDTIDFDIEWPGPGRNMQKNPGG
jgi:hypothetical protein